jgi:4-amino-4-deoxy-L-arabinose transferase-like glycosyltransferase
MSNEAIPISSTSTQIEPARGGFASLFFSSSFLILLALALFAILFTAPPDVGQNNERRMVAYVSDAIENGNWMCQHDETGGIASKPPMFCWLSASATVLIGQINRFTLYWPTAAATLLSGIVLFFAGKKYVSARAGFLAGWSYLLSHVALNQMGTCRYDGLFAFFVTLAALAAFHAWTTGQGWTWFWVASAGATLTKGPLGLILAAAGLLAAIWERKSPERKPMKGSHLWGVGIFFLITGGWFALAYWQTGGALVEKMIYQELFTHVVGKEKENLSRPGFYKPLVWFLTDFAPWSLLAILSIWRAWKNPSANVVQRRFERFLICELVVGLVLFSLGGHQRIRLIYPLIPAAALLAGMQLARLTASFSDARLKKNIFIITIVASAVTGLYLHLISTKSKGVREAVAMQKFASAIGEKVGDKFPFTHADPPFAFPYYLKELHQFASYARAAELLRGTTPAFVTVEELPRLQKQLGSNAPVFFELLRWPSEGAAMIYIVSNHPRLEWTEKMAMDSGPFRLELNEARLWKTRGHEFSFRAPANHASVKISNESKAAQNVRVRWENANAPVEKRSLKPGEKWAVKFDDQKTKAR